MSEEVSFLQALATATAERERRLASAQARVIEAAKRLEILWSAAVAAPRKTMRDRETRLAEAVRALNELEGA